VAGPVIKTAVVVGTTTGVILTRPDPPRIPPNPFVNVTSQHTDFNLSLSSATGDAISRGATPPSDAYQWLFASGNKPPAVGCPKTSRCQEMLHRFALAPLVYATGGNDSSWITTAGWLKSDGAPVPVARGRVHQRHRVRAVLVHERLRGSHGQCQVPNGTMAMEASGLSGNRLRRTPPGEIGMLGRPPLRESRSRPR
jgi:hypothetical protein